MNRPSRCARLLGAVALGATAFPALAAAPAADADPTADPSRAAQQSEQAREQVEEIVVRGRARSLYRSGDLDSSKLPVDPLLSSQTVSVINEALIRDQGARNAQEIYRNLSGVSLFSYAGVTARGFRQEEIFYDGLRGDPYAGFAVPQLFNVERLEFLKGPSGMLYGQTAPGGLFNYLTKTPEGRNEGRVSVIGGSRARRGAELEYDAALTDRLSGRFGVFHEAQDQARRGADSEITIVDAGLTRDLDRGRIVLQATRYEQDLGANRLRGVPVDADGEFIAGRRWNHNEPRDFLRLESDVLQGRIEYALTDALDFDAGLRWNDGQERQQYHEPFGLFDSDDDGTIDSSRRQYRDQVRDSEHLSFATNLIWTHSTGPLAHRTLFGADWFRQDSDFDGRSLSGGTTAEAGLPTPLSLRDPVYGVTDVASYVLPDFRTSSNRQERAGVYALNEATWGRFIGTVGVRLDAFDDENLVSGASFDDEVTTFRAGLVYRLRDDVSLFAHWADSFEPQGIGSQEPRAGGPFDPTEGEIFEAGVRTELLDGRVQSSASIYRIRRSNILQADPAGDRDNDGVNDLVNVGEVTSDGIEVDVTADLTPNWVLTASWAWNDARITDTAATSGIRNSVGDRFANAPEHQGGLWTRYQVPAWNTAFAIGADYVGQRVSLSDQPVPSYLVFDASIIHEVGDWRALLRIDNLLDETYAASGFIDRTGHFPGGPRSAFLEVTRRL